MGMAPIPAVLWERLQGYMVTWQHGRCHPKGSMTKRGRSHDNIQSPEELGASLLQEFTLNSEISINPLCR